MEEKVREGVGGGQGRGWRGEGREGSLKVYKPVHTSSVDRQGAACVGPCSTCQPHRTGGGEGEGGGGGKRRGGCLNSYNPNIAHHIINQLSQLLLRTHSTLECEAVKRVHWRTF